MQDITIRKVVRHHGHVRVEIDAHSGRHRFIFYTLDDDRFTRPVVYVGATTVGHYPVEKDVSDLPEEVTDALKSRGYTLLTGVDAGWESWEGRPEWSETYVDTDDAQTV